MGASNIIDNRIADKAIYALAGDGATTRIQRRRPKLRCRWCGLPIDVSDKRMPIDITKPDAPSRARKSKPKLWVDGKAMALHLVGHRLCLDALLKELDSLTTVPPGPTLAIVGTLYVRKAYRPIDDLWKVVYELVGVTPMGREHVFLVRLSKQELVRMAEELNRGSEHADENQPTKRPESRG